MTAPRSSRRSASAWAADPVEWDDIKQHLEDGAKLAQRAADAFAKYGGETFSFVAGLLGAVVGLAASVGVGGGLGSVFEGQSFWQALGNLGSDGVWGVGDNGLFQGSELGGMLVGHGGGFMDLGRELGFGVAQTEDGEAPPERTG